MQAPHKKKMEIEISKPKNKWQRKFSARKRYENHSKTKQYRNFIGTKQLKIEISRQADKNEITSVGIR